MVTCIKKSHELFYKNLEDIKAAAKRNQTDHIDSLWAFRLLFSVLFWMLSVCTKPSSICFLSV